MSKLLFAILLVISSFESETKYMHSSISVSLRQAYESERRERNNIFDKLANSFFYVNVKKTIS